MGNKWRPEGWDKGGNPKIKGVQYHNYDTDSFEAGADAMLEALKKISKGWVFCIRDEGENERT